MNKTAIVALALASTTIGTAQAQYGRAQPPFGSDADANAAKSLWRALSKAKLIGPDAIRGTPYRGTHPHGVVLTTLDAVVNVSGHKGAVIVKNNYGGREVSTRAVANDPDTYLQAITVMFKREAYSVETWQTYHWSIYNPTVRARIRKRFRNDTEAQQYLDLLERYFARNLLRAKRFHRAISVPVQQSPVRYIVFGGDCILTPARCLVETINGQSFVRLFPGEIKKPLPGVDYSKLMLEPGDGRVTKPSLLARNALDPSVQAAEPGAFPVAYAVLLCDGHSALTANITFQDNLLNILLTQETTEDRVNRHALPPKPEPLPPPTPVVPELG